MGRDARELVSVICDEGLSTDDILNIDFTNCDTLRTANWNLFSSQSSQQSIGIFGPGRSTREVTSRFTAQTSIGTCVMVAVEKEVKNSKTDAKESLQIDYTCGDSSNPASKGHVEFKDRPENR